MSATIAKPPSPYRMLGLPRRATAEDVKRAYRQLAKRHHPDHGGDRERFEAIHAAYEVLSDEDRRRKYDQTGEVDPRKADNTMAEVMSILMPALPAVLAEIAKQGGKLDSEDVVGHLKTAIKNAEKNLVNQRTELAKTKKALEESLPRFEVDDGQPNLLAAAAREHLRHIDAATTNFNGELGRIKKALEYLKRCRYTHIARVMSGWATTDSATVNWTRVG
jgi:hypothetical protein